LELTTMDDANRTEAAKVERFAALLATCQRPVYLYALSLLHNGTDAEEVLQETNLVLWRKFDQYQPGTRFVSWACRIARYEVFKFLERKPAKERLFSTDFLESLAVAAEESIPEVDDRRCTLNSCLGKLSDKDRQLITGRYQESATTRSLAEALGRSIQGTRRSLHRIRATLLTCVERNTAKEEHA
jgi:RNA polymerase sigma-70 factor (ECF subfamily)